MLVLFHAGLLFCFFFNKPGFADRVEPGFIYFLCDEYQVTLQRWGINPQTKIATDRREMKRNVVAEGFACGDEGQRCSHSVAQS